MTRVSAVHYGKLRGTRQTFIKVAKISSFFWAVLGLFVQIKSDNVVQNHVFT